MKGYMMKSNVLMKIAASQFCWEKPGGKAVLLALVAGTLMSGMSQAQVIYFTGFEAPTYTVSDGNRQSILGQDGWESGFGSGGRYVLNGNNPDNPNAPVGSQLAGLWKTANAGNTGIRRQFTLTTTPFSASFYTMVRFNETGLSLHTPITFQATDSTSNGVRVGFYGDGTNVYAYYRNGSSIFYLDADPLTEGIQGISSDTFYIFELDIDPTVGSGGSFTVTLKNSEGNVLSTGSGSATGNGNFEWVRWMNLNTASGEVWAYMDELKITMIPEASINAMIMGFVCVLTLFYFHRRKRR